MARAAARFLESLNAAQRQAAHYDLASPERRRWTNAPVRGQASGVALGDLDDARLRVFSDLLAALLSAKGYAKVRDVMLGDDLRATVDGEPNEGVGIEAFRFAVFGDPSPASRWAVQLDGHHVALNVTLDGDAYSLSPGLIGTYPQAFTVAGRELRPLAAETDLAHELTGSLTPEQRAWAVVGERLGALRVGPGRDGVVPEPVGIPGGLLDARQRETLLALASQWFDLMPAAHARAQKERFLDRIDETRFAWSGPLAAGSARCELRRGRQGRRRACGRACRRGVHSSPIGISSGVIGAPGGRRHRYECSPRHVPVTVRSGRHSGRRSTSRPCLDRNTRSSGRDTDGSPGAGSSRAAPGPGRRPAAADGVGKAWRPPTG